ncbi:MAG TPA: alpha/beta hydrolase [Candidatus Saccharimonadales bacterium]|nr:alpha/beta hydrolase [Candidatus Saccharimonadales bacterium]
MVKTSQPNPQDYIVPLNMNGLNGRMLHMPAPKSRNREILFVYGHHSSLERWFGIMQNLNRYGAVTMPDLPGFGGMDSFYKIGEEATIDNLADYLAAFIKMRYKRRKVVIAGMSFGFVVATRMLQRYPELTKKVDLFVSIAGFAHKDDFTFSGKRQFMYRSLIRLFSFRLTALFFRYVILHPFFLRHAYKRTHNAKNKFQDLAADELQEMLDVEIGLWHDNDVRTHMKTSAEFLNLDNCKVKVDLPVHHVAIAGDRYFDNHIVEQHYRVIFREFNLVDTLRVGNHAPSIIADAKAAAPFVPPKLRRLLLRKAKA